MGLDGILSSCALEVCRRVLEEESRRRHHVVVALSGAHAYGFPSPDSDLDLKAIHVASTRDLVGLEAPALHADRMEVIEGVEIDYTSNELGPALRGILAGNGNYIERVLGALLTCESPVLAELQPIVQRSLSRNVFRHYHGFASGQRSERAVLSEADKQRWTREVERAFTLLEEAHSRSPLPASPPNAGEFSAWLDDVRRRLVGPGASLVTSGAVPVRTPRAG